MYATCETTGCSNVMAPIQFDFPEGEEVTVVCGVCSVPVTNITDIKPVEGTVLPEWISEMLKQQNSAD